MNDNKFVVGAIWAFSLVLTIVFLVLGLGKLISPESQLGQYLGWGIPLWGIRVLGAAEIFSGISLLLPRLASVGSAFLCLEMAGFAILHTLNAEQTLFIRAIIFIFLLLGISYLRIRNTDFHH